MGGLILGGIALFSDLFAAGGAAVGAGVDALGAGLGAAGAGIGDVLGGGAAAAGAGTAAADIGAPLAISDIGAGVAAGGADIGSAALGAGSYGALTAGDLAGLGAVDAGTAGALGGAYGAGGALSGFGGGFTVDPATGAFVPIDATSGISGTPGLAGGVADATSGVSGTVATDAASALGGQAATGAGAAAPDIASAAQAAGAGTGTGGVAAGGAGGTDISSILGGFTSPETGAATTAGLPTLGTSGTVEAALPPAAASAPQVGAGAAPALASAPSAAAGGDIAASSGEFAGLGNATEGVSGVLSQGAPLDITPAGAGGGAAGGAAGAGGGITSSGVSQAAGGGGILDTVKSIGGTLKDVAPIASTALLAEALMGSGAKPAASTASSNLTPVAAQQAGISQQQQDLAAKNQANVPQLQKSAAAGISAYDAMKLTAPQQQQIDTWTQNQINQTRQLYASSGRDYTHDTDYLSAVANIQAQALSMEQQFLTANLASALQEQQASETALGGAGSALGGASSALSGASSTINSQAQLSLQQDQNFQAALQNAFRGLGIIAGQPAAKAA